MLKRVCIVRHGYYPRDPRVRKEVEALIGGGCQVDVICLRNAGEKRRDEINGVHIYRLPLSHRRGSLAQYVYEYTLSFILFTFVLSFLFFKKKYDAIQVNTLPDFLVFVTLIPKLCGAKVILDMHEAMPELFRSSFGLSKKHPSVKLVEWLERWSTWYADCVLATCESMLALYVDRGLSRCKTALIPNVPDERLFSYQKYNDQKAGMSKTEFTVISHGTLLERFGMQVLIKAVPYLKQYIPNIKVLVVGDGEYLGHLRQLAGQLGLQNYVSFTGRIPLESVPMVVSKADIGVVPIVRDEFTDVTASNKLFEYVAMRKPVVAVRIRGIRDYFDDSCVMFFESGNEKELAECILQLYRNPDRAKELVENAWSRYEKVRWNMTKQVYLKVVADRLGRPASAVET